MRVAGLIVGVLGSIGGFIGALLALLVLISSTTLSAGARFGGLGAAVDAPEVGTVTTRAFVVLAASIVGLVGAALSVAKPRMAASLMVVSAVVGVIAIFAAYILATVLLSIGALLTFLGRNENRT